MVGETITPELRARILENLELKLDREDSVNLRTQIKEIGYKFGTCLKGCPCPRCDKDLTFTFAYGSACLKTYNLNVKSGCGYVGINLIKKD